MGGSRVTLSPATWRPVLARTGVIVWLAAGLILALALAARTYNLGWDEGTHIHPDERHLTFVASDISLPSTPREYFDSDTSRLNPYNLPNAGSFVYGTLPLFMTKVTAVVLGMDNFDDLVMVGRHLTALFDVGTVLLVFLIGRRLYGNGAGLMGAALYAAAPLAIQHSHFFVVDPYLTFFMAAALYAAVRLVQDGRSIDYVLLGLALGLGMASKVTGALFLPVLLAAVALRVWPLLRGGISRRAVDALSKPLLGAAIALIVAFMAFRVAQPYAFEAPRLGNFGVSLNQRWVDDQQNQNRLLSGEVGFPPSVQWIDRDSYFYPLQQMLFWGMGPAFGLAGWLAAAYAALRLLRWRETRHLLPLVFVIVYFGFMGRQFSLYLRYFLPLLPVLAVLAGYGLAELHRGARELAQRRGRVWLEHAGSGAVALVLVLSLLAGIAYLGIYGRPFTRVEATRWMLAEIPAGATIAHEEWDEGLPLSLPGVPEKRFTVYGLQLYHPDTPEKSEKLINDLDRADYVVVSSNRLMNSIPRNPVNYPLTSRYYEMLLGGHLGFELVASFTSYPGLLGIDFPDHAAQESWSSYDHPRVLIFAKAAGYSRENLQMLLGQGPRAGAVLPPAAAERNLLLGSSESRTQRQGGTWSDLFSDSGIVASHPTLVWLLALQAAAFAATPLALTLFRRLPDRGYLLAKPLGVLLLAYPVWLLVSLRLVHFTQATVLSCLVALLLLGAALAWWRRAELWQFLRSNWRLVLFCEALFLLAFLGFRELRLENPDLWHPFRGGEKPMDFAYLTAIARSTTLPAYDPWFAGGYLNYSYLGQFLTATLIKLTTIPPEVAYNLAVPTFFALTLAGAFSVAYNLAASAGGYARHVPGFRGLPAPSFYAAGLLGAVFVAVAANLDGVGQLADRLSAVSAWQLSTGLPLFDNAVNSVGGLWQVTFGGASIAPFDFWRSSRMMPPTISITEFPYFSFLFADLHAHMMAIAFQLLAIGACLSLVLNRRGERDAWRDVALIVLLGLVVGSLRWLNSWDYPPFLLLALAALLINERRMEGGFVASGRRLALKGGLLVLLSVLLYQPFLANYRAPVSGLHPSPETTPVHQYLAHFGVFAALCGAWLLFLLGRALRAASGPAAGPGSRQGQLAMALSLCLPAMVAGVVFVLLARGQELVAVLLPVFVLTVYLAVREVSARRPDGGLRLFLLSLVGLGLGLSMGVDLVTLNGDIGRMNTVFKFYLHVWLLFAIASAFAAWYLLFFVALPALRNTSRQAPRLVAQAGVTVALLLVMGALVYPLAATRVRLDDRFVDTPRTLDGMAFMRQAVYRDANGPIELSYDYEGIQWLRRNVEGTPAIIEGRSDLYRWGNRFAIYTGLPAVLGWDWHQVQQRGEMSFMVGQRAREVDEFYRDPGVGQAVTLLRRYEVRYVVVGRLERLYYPEAGLTKFDSGLGGALEVVFRNQELTIYEVRPEVLAPAVVALP